MSCGTSLDLTPSYYDPSYLGTSLEQPCFQHTTVRDAFESVFERRRSWRTQRGGEMIWSPELEAALLEGLEAYKPDDSRETRILGRFPMRNQFLSEYIYHKTGTHRSPKQVSSRLQQLRDTCSSKSLMKLLQPCRPPPRRCSSRNHRDSPFNWGASPAAEDTPVPLHYLDRATQPSRKVIYIDILPNNRPRSNQHHTSFAGERCEFEGAHNAIRLYPHPRPLHSINPTITLMSRSMLSAYSVFTVCSAGKTVFSGTSRLNVAGTVAERADGALLYSTTLVPEFWQHISDDEDPTRYTIFQDVIRNGQVSSLIFSAAYKFVYPPATTSDNFTTSFMEPSDENTPLHAPQMSLSADCRLASLDYNFQGYNSDFVAAEAQTYDGLFDVVDGRAWEASSPYEVSTTRMTTPS